MIYKTASLDDIPIDEKFYLKDQNTGRISRAQIFAGDRNIIFIYAPNKKIYGRRWSRPDVEQQFYILVEDKEHTWKANMRSAISHIQTSGLWPQLIPLYENLSQMTYEEHEFLKKNYILFNQNPQRDEILQEMQNLRQKYPFAFLEGKSLIAQDASPKKPFVYFSVRLEYIADLSDCKLKSMYFGAGNKQIKNQIRSALIQQKEYQTAQQAFYDVRFIYDPKVQKAWYSEEYKGCANGHYYLALDHSRAVFCEND